MISKIDNETGEIYGNVPDTLVGMKFKTRMELQNAKLHTDLQSDVSTRGNYSKPAASVIIYDTQDQHEDRGTVVLYSVLYPRNMSLASSPPSLQGTCAQALAQNSLYKIPVRVIRGKYESAHNNGNVARSLNSHCPQQGYRYDGIYFVGEYFYEPSVTSYIFKLIRIYGQTELPHFPNLAEQPQNLSMNSQASARPPIIGYSPTSTKGIFGIPETVVQRILSKSPAIQDSTTNSYSLPQIPKIPSSYTGTYNSNNNLPSFSSIQSPYYNPPNSQQPNNFYSTIAVDNSNVYSTIRSLDSGNRQVQMSARDVPYLPSTAPSQSYEPQQNQNRSQGVDLSRDKVRQMISNLRNQNNTYGGRIGRYSNHLNELQSKFVDITKMSPSQGRQLTSRNKTFTWKLGEERDRSKYFVYDDDDDSGEGKNPKKRKQDSTENSSSENSESSESENSPNQ